MTAGAPTPSPIASADPDPAQTRVDLELSAAGLARGSTVGRYVVIAPIGEGGMGEVVRAYDPKLRREVALKRLRSEALDPTSVARLVREAQAMAQLNHPNVVAVYDVDRTDAGVILAMEFVDGLSLTEWLESPRSWSEILPVFVQAGRALQAAHDAGLVHRDFKPGNVMLGRDARVRVMDFGLARAVADDPEGDGVLDAGDDPAPPHPDTIPAPSVSPREIDVTDSRSGRLTEHGAIVGTPAYMAPEQHAGGHADARSDQYAFCVALWEALYGELPFRGSMAALAFTKLDGPPAMPRARVPRWIHEIVARGLQADPDARFSAMEPLLAALQRDPVRTRRRMVAGVGVLAIAAASAVMLSAREDAPSPCPDPRAELAGIWDDARKDAIASAIRSRPLAYADTTAHRLAERLDAYADAWVAMKIDACAATHLRGEQSADMLDRRTACLQRRRQQLAALTGMLVGADDAMVERSVGLLGALSPIEPCGDLQALSAEVPPPDRPEIATAVEDLRARLVEVGALGQGGRFDDALAVVDPIVNEAIATAYDPVIAEAYRSRAAIHALAGNFDKAEADLEIAYRTALAAGSDFVAQDAAVSLTTTVGMHQARVDAGRAWSSAALALAQRLDPEGRRMGDALNARGSIEFRAGRFAQAEADFRRAVELFEATIGIDDPVFATGLNHLGAALDEQQRYIEAEAHFRRAVEVGRAAFGDDHPSIANFMGNVAVNLALQGRHDEARELQEEVLVLRERTLGPEHPSTALSHVNLGWTLLEHEPSDPEAAATHFAAARDAFEKKFGAEHPQVAMATEGIATAEAARGRLDVAEALHRRALEIRAKTLGSTHPNVAASHLGLVKLLERQDRHADALVEIERALAILDARPEDGRRFHPEALHWHGRLLRSRGRSAEARAPLLRAIELSTGDGDKAKLPAIRFTLAQAMLDAGDPIADARAQAEQALADLSASDTSAAAQLATELRRWLSDHPSE